MTYQHDNGTYPRYLKSLIAHVATVVVGGWPELAFLVYHLKSYMFDLLLKFSIEFVFKKRIYLIYGSLKPKKKTRVFHFEYLFCFIYYNIR